LLYQPDCDNDCKQNVREFLEFLHDFEQESEDASRLKDFVYASIKNFAEQNQKAYQASNLIDLMNKVVDLRRGDIFDDTASMSSLTNLSNRGGAEDRLGASGTKANHQASNKAIKKVSLAK
jgi:hypothetical protein